MESNTVRTSRKTKFAETIQKAWKKACEIYLRESGLKEGSAEWTFINDTNDPSQIVEVINETWAHHNTRSTTAGPEPAHYVSSSSAAKKTGFKAVTNRFNKLIGRKESGKILLQPASSTASHQSYIDERLSLTTKLSGKPSKGKDVVETGLEITTQLEIMTESDKLKTLVETVMKFSTGLQSLASVSEVVTFLYNIFLISKWAPYASLGLGCIRLFFKAASDLWASYDRITSLLLDFNDIGTRIKVLESVDQDLLLGVVYMEAFEHLLRFVGILTRYVRNRQLVNYLKHLGGEDDELQSIQDKLKQLQHKENLYAAIENLKFSISTENTLRRMAHSQDDEKVLSWLGSNTAQNNHNTARKKHEPTTGNWFLQSETFTQWSNATKSSLWLYGKAGSGKTILCSTIIERIIEICGSSNPADKCAYFYFDFQAKWNADDMLRSIIVQFCASKREVPRELHHLHQECLDGRRQPRKSSLLEILFSLLTTSSRTFVILDALDECINRADLLDTIEEIVKVSTKYLNVLVTSRKERDIDKRLKTLFVYDVALEENVIDSDITLHIHECLKNDAELRTWDLETKNNIEQALLKGAHGMFRWVECQLISLKHCRDIEDIETALNEPPESLDATYDRILDNIRGGKDRKRARCVLQLIAVAYRPLTVQEISEALTVDCELETINPKRRMRDPFGILEICSSLLDLSENPEEENLSLVPTTHSETLRFAHFSVKEFLVSSRILHPTRPSAFFAICQPDAHRFATTVCLIYLISAIEISTPTSEHFPLIRYAAEYWYTHLTATTSKIREALEYNLVTKLFDSPSDVTISRWLSLHDPEYYSPYYRNAVGPPGPLYYSSLLGLANIAEWLLGKGAKVNRQGGSLGNALQAASYGGCQEVVALLLKNGAEVNAQGGEYENALQAASYSGYQEVVALLLDNGAEVNAQGGYYGNALQAASYGGHQEVVALLLEHGAEVNVQGGYYGNALQVAPFSGCQEVVTLLLDNGAEVHAQGGPFGNALGAASFGGHQEVVELLLERGAQF